MEPVPAGHSNRAALFVMLGLGALAACAFTALVVGLISLAASHAPASDRGGIAPGAVPATPAPPDARVTLRVLDEGCAVERGEVTGGDAVDNVTWVVADEFGAAVLERLAANETVYRYFAAGRYTVHVKAWHDGAYWQISDSVPIDCP